MQKKTKHTAYTLNIGLDVDGVEPTWGTAAQADVSTNLINLFLAAYSPRAEIVSAKILDRGEAVDAVVVDEPTLVVLVVAPEYHRGSLFHTFAHQLCRVTQQDSIAVVKRWVDRDPSGALSPQAWRVPEGWLLGPDADKWGPFNVDYFAEAQETRTFSKPVSKPRRLTRRERLARWFRGAR